VRHFEVAGEILEDDGAARLDPVPRQKALINAAARRL